MNAITEPQALAAAEEYRLQVLDRYDILDMPPDPSLSRIAQAAAALSHSVVGLVSIVDRQQLVFKAGADELPCKTLPRKSSLCDAAIQENARFEVPDVKADSRFQIYWQPGHPLVGQVVSYAGVPLRTPEGPVLGMLCVIGSQTRYLADDQWNALEVLADSAMSILEARSNALRSLRNIGAMIETLSSEFLLLDADSLHVLYANAGVAQRVACQAGELPGLALQEIYSPEVCRQIELARDALKAGGLDTVPLECKLRRADGTTTYAKGSIQLRGWQGRRALVVITNDVSQLTIERDARAAAEAANLAKSEFLARVSHELRTPLNAVLGFSQLMLSDPKEPLSRHQSAQIDSIRQAGWHLLALISDVLDISRIESSRLSIQPESVPLHELLDDVIELVQPLAETARVVIQPLYRDQDEVCVWGDPVRIRQAVINLLGNGVKYNRPGGAVRIDAIGRRGQVQLKLEDTGLGMTREQLAHLFEPFNRLGRERGKIEGTGIGMALAQQLILLMGGRVHVESEAGRGTTVYVSLPMATGIPKAVKTPASMRAAPGGEPEGVVLYIEDNEVNLMIVEQFLSRWPKLRVARATDGESGLAMARDLQPDLVLLDMHLPDMSGLQVLALLGNDPLTRSLRVVALSASAMPEDLRVATQAGALAYWTKPLDLPLFGTNLQRLLGEAAG